MKKILGIIFILFIQTSLAQAADVSIIAPSNITKQSQFNVFVNLNTDGVLVNSLDISLSYPKDIMTFSGYKEDGGIKKIWLVQPKDINGEIHFSGIIPGGVDGVYDPDKSGLQPIPLVQLIFKPKQNGEGQFLINYSNVLENDGVGTSLIHTKNNASISISIPESDKFESSISEDKELPEPFEIQYIPSSFFSKTPSMISFFTNDTQSGVEKYQIKDAHNVWNDAISPTEAPKGIFKRSIEVRAIDFSGNIRESSVDIPGLLSPLQLAGIFIFFLACYFLFFVVKRKR